MQSKLLQLIVLAASAAVPVFANGQTREPQIVGRVVRSDNGQPIEGATIELERALVPTSDGHYPSTTTDKNGEYRLGVALVPAVYRIKATAEGFVWQTYSRDGSHEGELLRFGEPTDFHGIDFKLAREATIRGVLINTTGGTTGQGVSVTLVRKSEREKGSFRWLPVDTVKADGSGQFVFTKLESGTYFVCVNGPNGFNAFADNQGWYREAWYGDDGSAKNAKALTLKEGDEQSGLRIKLEREQRYTVTVWASGPEGQLRPSSYSMRIEGRSHTSTQRPDGSYLIPGIPPGRYRLLSVAWLDSQYPGGGETWFEVTNSDVTVHLHVGGLGGIEGIATSDDAQAKIPAGVMIGIKSQEGAAQGKDVDAMGHFAFDRVLPGHYQFKLLKNPAGVVLRSVKCGGAEIRPDTPLLIGDRQIVKNCEAVLGTDADTPAQ